MRLRFLPWLVALLLSASALPSRAQPVSEEALYARMIRHVDARMESLVNIRHDIHRNPELSGQERRTAGIVAAHLRSLGFDVQSGIGGHGVVGILRGGYEGPIVAFRADMDAVRSAAPDPVEYRSERPGVRHICGHDVHTTVGLGLAEAFSAVRDELAGSVMLIFQPAEETGMGAKAMMEDGAFAPQAPSAIFAVHTTPHNVGQLATRPGGLMAGRASFTATIQGNGDVNRAAREVRTAIGSVGTVDATNAQRPAPDGFVYVQFFPGGGAVRGQVMTAGYEDRARAKSEIQEAVEALDFDDVTITLNYDDGFMEGVTNDASLVDRANDAIRRLAPDLMVVTSQGASPVFSEDFGSFQLHAPGAMYFLGVSNPETGTRGMPHAPDYVADDASIAVGVRAMGAAMLAALAGNRQAR